VNDFGYLFLVRWFFQWHSTTSVGGLLLLY